MKRPVIVVGGGGHARVLIDTLKLSRIEIVGICDPQLAPGANGPNGLTVIGDNEALAEYPPGEVDLVNGVGSADSTVQRRQVFETFVRRGYRFADVIHPAAVTADDVATDAGVQIMAGAVIQTGTTIGPNSIVNTGAVIDHDCTIGGHVHIAPAAALSGGVRIGDGTHVGIGAAVIQTIKVGADCVIGAGAVIVRDVADGAKIITPGKRSMPLDAS